MTSDIWPVIFHRGEFDPNWLANKKRIRGSRGLRFVVAGLHLIPLKQAASGP